MNEVDGQQVVGTALYIGYKIQTGFIDFAAFQFNVPAA
jgi:hypothetical protein